MKVSAFLCLTFVKVRTLTKELSKLSAKFKSICHSEARRISRKTSKNHKDSSYVRKTNFAYVIIINYKLLLEFRQTYQIILNH